MDSFDFFCPNENGIEILGSSSSYVHLYMFQLFSMQNSEEMVLKSLQKDPSPKPSIPTSRRIVTAGGGAHRLAQLFMDSLTVEVVPFKEMDSG